VTSCRPVVLLVRAHGGLTSAVALAAHTIAALTVGRATLTAGILTTWGAFSVPTTSVLPALATFAFVRVVGEPVLGEPTAARPLTAYRWLLLGVLLVLAHGSLVAFGALTGHLLASLAAARNLAGLLGLALALRPWLEDGAWLVFGGTSALTPAPWAFTMHDTQSRTAALTSVVLFGAGLAVLAWHWRPCST
jgi:hypothetical protein